MAEQTRIPSVADSDVCNDCPFYMSFQAASEVIEADTSNLSSEVKQQRLSEYEIIDSIFATVSRKIECEGPEMNGENNSVGKCAISGAVNDAIMFAFKNPDLRVQGNQNSNNVGF